MDIQTDRALVPANTDVTRYLTVVLTAPDPGRRTDRPALNVAFVIDRSGSMSGRKLDMAKKAVEQAIRLLDERDRFALVCYDHEVQTLVASAPASAETKALALDRLKTLDARGNTDLSGGWMRGAEEVGAVREADAGTSARPDALSRVLLLSDGLANNGETDPDVLARKAAELRAKGIATSTFGVGADFDEVLMSRLATDGGGPIWATLVTEPMLIIRPYPRGIMLRAIACATKNVPRRLVSSTRFQSSQVMSSAGFRTLQPALLTRMSIFGYAAAAASAMRWMLS